MTRQPSCDVCEWATSEVQAFDMNLCVDCEETLGLAAKSERERIIALLEADKCANPECRCGDYDLAIALIKGEPK